MPSLCGFSNCGRPQSCRGLCASHYEQLRSGEDLRPIRRRAPDGLSAKEALDLYGLPLDSGCIEWTGQQSGHGYGKVNLEGKRYYAHRVAYEHSHGTIPEGLVINHICGFRSCVNPDHLEAITQTQNKQFKTTAARTRGTYFHRSTGKWNARVQVNGTIHSLGYFSTQDEAIEAATRGREIHGMHNPKLREESDA